MRLWNAHRRVFLRRHVRPEREKKLLAEPDGWRKIVSSDVRDWVDKLAKSHLADSPGAQRKRIIELVKDPARFFSIPKNVPKASRRQIYLPNFVVSLMRTPEMSPYYASFNVPLSFNKLDLSNYLKNVYNVDVLHIRSSVRYQKVQRQKIKRPNSVVQGPLYRPPFLKIMIAELIDPFVYPEPEKDLTAWNATDSNKRELYESYQRTKQEQGTPAETTKEAHRKAVAEQAEMLLSGKRKWKPSWQSIPADVRVLQSTIGASSSSKVRAEK